MLTIFTCPKAFSGATGARQKNAIGSWMRLRPAPEVILMGDDSGVAQIARDFGCRHIEGLCKNEFGTPLVSSIFKEGQDAAKHEIVAYVNADILLGECFGHAVTVSARYARFLMVGRRWQSKIDESLDLGDCGWWREEVRRVREAESVDSVDAIDYFVFRRGLFSDLPPFALGRCAWDNWLIFRARSSCAKVIDATACVMAIHQMHGYEHAREGERSAMWRGSEAERNYALAEGHLYDLRDCNWRMLAGGPRPVRDRESVVRRVEGLQGRRPGLWKAIPSWKLRHLLCRLFPEL